MKCYNKYIINKINVRNSSSSENIELFNYSNGFNPSVIRNYPTGYGNDLDSDYSLKNIISPNRPSTAPLKKDRGNNEFGL